MPPEAVQLSWHGLLEQHDGEIYVSHPAQLHICRVACTYRRSLSCPRYLEALRGAHLWNLVELLPSGWLQPLLICPRWLSRAGVSLYKTILELTLLRHEQNGLRVTLPWADSDMLAYFNLGLSCLEILGLIGRNRQRFASFLYTSWCRHIPFACAIINKYPSFHKTLTILPFPALTATGFWISQNTGTRK